MLSFSMITKLNTLTTKSLCLFLQNCPDDVISTMRQHAEKSLSSDWRRGFNSRDFFYTDKGEIFLNELNTMPGFTQWSNVSLLWKIWAFLIQI